MAGRCRTSNVGFPARATATGLPSLDTLLDLVRDERAKQIGHFDALDNKAGITLGLAGLLITLAPDVHAFFLIPGLAAATAAACFALAAFWPRPHAGLKPTPMRKYLTADDRFTRLRMFDTLEVVVNTISHDLSTKASRLRRALTALVVAAVLFAVGILVTGLEGAQDVGSAARPTAIPTRAPGAAA